MDWYKVRQNVHPMPAAHNIVPPYERLPARVFSDPPPFSQRHSVLP